MRAFGDSITSKQSIALQELLLLVFSKGAADQVAGVAMDLRAKAALIRAAIAANEIGKQPDHAFHNLSSALNHLIQVEAATLVAEHQSLVTFVGIADLLQLHVDETMDKTSNLQLEYEAAKTNDGPTTRASVRKWVIDQAVPNVFVTQGQQITRHDRRVPTHWKGVSEQPGCRRCR
jgi:uncharacterized protein YqiB (DUF1249 family)